MTALLEASPVPCPPRMRGAAQFSAWKCGRYAARARRQANGPLPVPGLSGTPARPNVVAAGTPRYLLGEFRHCAEWPPSARPSGAWDAFRRRSVWYRARQMVRWSCAIVTVGSNPDTNPLIMPNRCRSGDFGGLVDAPHLAQRVAHLAHGRLGAQRLAERDEDVLRACRGLLEIGDPALPLPGVAGAAQPREPLRLVPLDRRVHPERLVGLAGLVAGRGEPVHPHHHPLAVVDLTCDPVGGALDLGLLEAALDGGHRPAEVVDAGDQVARGGL